MKWSLQECLLFVRQTYYLKGSIILSLHIRYTVLKIPVIDVELKASYKFNVYKINDGLIIFHREE